LWKRFNSFDINRLDLINNESVHFRRFGRCTTRCHSGHLNIKGTLYDEARTIATRVTLAVADELNKNGFDNVVIADSHGPMVTIYIDELPDYAEIVRGFPRPLSMVAGVESADVAIFLGYHAKFGTARSTFDHTYSGASIHTVEVNGVPVSEFLLNGYVAGELQVPVILVAGEAKLIEDDVKPRAPWIETVALKHSFSRTSARSPSLNVTETCLREALRRAVLNFKRGKTQLLNTGKPVTVKMTFTASHFADVAEMLPRATRTSGLTIEYSAQNMTEAYKTFELLILAASGVSATLENVR